MAAVLLLLTTSCDSADEKTKRAQLPVATAPAEDCTAASFDGREYWFCKGFKDRKGAQEACADKGLHLARVDGAAENIFIQSHIQPKAWLGGFATDGIWKWHDGTAFWSSREDAALGGFYNNWSAPQPKEHERKPCMRIAASDGQWKSSNCNERAAYVCESEPVPTPPGAPDASCVAHSDAGRTYWFCSGQRTFEDARASCRSAGQDIVTIDSAAENGFLASRTQTPSVS